MDIYVENYGDIRWNSWENGSKPLKFKTLEKRCESHVRTNEINNMKIMLYLKWVFESVLEDYMPEDASNEGLVVPMVNNAYNATLNGDNIIDED